MILAVLQGCGLYLGADAVSERLDADGDGFIALELGGDDCNDRQSWVYPGAVDEPYDGVDADCAGNDDFDADGDGLRPRELGGADCDDRTPTVRNTPIAWRLDCDADGVPGEVVEESCGEPDRADRCGAGADEPWVRDRPGLLVDCDDDDAGAFPGRPDVPYDGRDANCDGRNDYDADGDGFVAAGFPAMAGGTAPGVGDCDDTDPSAWPGQPEIFYNGVDNDCAGGDDFDADGDGVRAPDGVPGTPDDCNDLDASILPGAPDDPYDGLDSDCDGPDSFDLDGDGAPHPAIVIFDPSVSLALTDCDDGDPAVRPGVPDAPYDGQDADCDGRNDYDADGDGFVPDAWASVAGLPAGDCDDLDRAVSPAALDLPYDGVDSDCAGDDDFDRDRDGARVDVDCDDTDPAVRPGLPDAWYDGVDSDCDGRNDFDADGDGFVRAANSDRAGGTAPGQGDCDDADASVNPGRPEDFADPRDEDCNPANELDHDLDGWPTADDCDDADPRVFPGAPEVWYDGLDQGCDGGDDYDADGDGFYPPGVPSAPVDPALHDCDDFRADVNPGVLDVPYDGVDADCAGDDDDDADGDGVPVDLDCDDTDPTVFPGAPEVFYDGIDQDCRGDLLADLDRDGDGHYLADCSLWIGPTDCAALVAASCGGLCDDCDDGNPDIHPGVADRDPYDGVEEGCRPGYDQDGDGYVWFVYDGLAGPGQLTGDCDDLDAAIHPGASDVWYDGVDSDCDGANDFDADGDGRVLEGFPYEAQDLQIGDQCDDDPLGWVADRRVGTAGDLLAVDDGLCAEAVLTLGPGVYVLDRPVELGRSRVELVGGPSRLVASGAHRLVDADVEALVVRDVTLSGGTGDDGGCLRAHGDVELHGVTLEGCTATGSGGGAWISGTLRATDLTALDGSATGGAGLYVTGGALDVDLDGVELLSNRATSDGAGVLVAGTGTVRITGLRSLDDAAAADGGALWLGGDLDVELVDLQALADRAGGTGAAVFAEGVSGSVSGLVVSLGQAGGALVEAVDAGSLELSALVVSGGSAPRAVAVVDPLGSVVLDDVVVRGVAARQGLVVERAPDVVGWRLAVVGLTVPAGTLSSAGVVVDAAVADLAWVTAVDSPVDAQIRLVRGGTLAAAVLGGPVGLEVVGGSVSLDAVHHVLGAVSVPSGLSCPTCSASPGSPFLAARPSNDVHLVDALGGCAGEGQPCHPGYWGAP
ncbi:MAG: hypothetical protein H6734_08865 [Alphaproteobacteria bacterium]|nr:hypothetical protein [Alphaproteobacteria bacterium]